MNEIKKNSLLSKYDSNLNESQSLEFALSTKNIECAYISQRLKHVYLTLYIEVSKTVC